MHGKGIQDKHTEKLECSFLEWQYAVKQLLKRNLREILVGDG